MVNYLPKTDFIMNWITVTFPFVLISHNEIEWILSELLRGEGLDFPIFQLDSFVEYRGNTGGLKKWH
jgi:hypothetical protein